MFFLQEILFLTVAFELIFFIEISFTRILVNREIMKVLKNSLPKVKLQLDIKIVSIYLYI